MDSVEKLGVRNDVNKRYLIVNKTGLGEVGSPKHMHISTERPKEEHTGESFILGNQKDWMHIWSACALMHAVWRTNRKKQRSVCSYKVTVSLGS